MLKKKFPQGLGYLITIGFLERLSFWSLQSLIFFYILGFLFDGVEQQHQFYASYLVLYFLTPLLGGWIADAFLGNQQSLKLGILMQSFGLFLLLYKNMYATCLGIGAIIMGAGFARVNLFALLAKLYGKENPHVDMGFTAFYYLVNCAGLLAPFFIMPLAKMIDWNYTCGFVGILLLTSLIVLERGKASFGYHGLEPSFNTKMSRLLPYATVKYFFTIVSIGFVPVTALLLWQQAWIETFIPIIAIFVVAFLAYLGAVHKLWKHVLLLLCVIFFNMVFMLLFDQVASFIQFMKQHAFEESVEVVYGRPLTMLLFENFGTAHTTLFFNLMNVSVLFVAGPLVIFLWHLATKKSTLYRPTLKFSLGFFFAAIGFALLSQTHRLNITSFTDLPFWWLVVTQFFLVAGELLIVPIAMAQVARIVPYKYLGTMIGIWFLSLALAQKFGDWFIYLMHIEHFDAAQCSFENTCDVFVTFGLWAFLCAALALVISLFFRKSFKSLLQ